MRTDKLTRVIFLVMTLVLLGLAILFRFAADRVRPALPAAKEVRFITVLKEEKTKKYSSAQEIEDALGRMAGGRRIECGIVHETPPVKEYSVITVSLKNGEPVELYQYEQKGNWYLEQPGVGVWRLTRPL